LRANRRGLRSLAAHHRFSSSCVTLIGISRYVRHDLRPRLRVHLSSTCTHTFTIIVVLHNAMRDYASAVHLSSVAAGLLRHPHLCMYLTQCPKSNKSRLEPRLSLSLSLSGEISVSESLELFKRAARCTSPPYLSAVIILLGRARLRHARVSVLAFARFSASFELCTPPEWPRRRRRRRRGGRLSERATSTPGRPRTTDSRMLFP